ncbi:MAG: M43 family zinc metalloprotease [Nitrospinota bacterium]|nr:M43 family zinc metalloprotease [Nitrospinota bacterium]
MNLSRYIVRAALMCAPLVVIVMGVAMVLGGCEKNYKEPPVYSVGFNFHLVDMDGDSAEARNRIETMIAVARDVYKKVNFEIGSIEVHVYTGADAQRLTNQDLERDENNNGWPDDMEELLTWSSNTPNLNMDIFLVKSISYAGEMGILGIAGGIPGPVQKGTPNSGVILNTFGGLYSMSGSDLNLQGFTLAHEADHYLGLYHTTERDGTEFDFLDDTPQCPSWQFDRNNDGLVSPIECIQMDGQYLMFWAAGPIIQDKSSSKQAEVKRRHPMSIPK